MVPGGRTDRVDRGRAGPTRGEHLDAALPPRVPSGQMGPRSASLSPFFWGGGVSFYISEANVKLAFPFDPRVH